MTHRRLPVGHFVSGGKGLQRDVQNRAKGAQLIVCHQAGPGLNPADHVLLHSHAFCLHFNGQRDLGHVPAQAEHPDLSAADVFLSIEIEFLQKFRRLLCECTVIYLALA